MKKRVKMLDSVAGLADPRPQAELDAKYVKMRENMKNQDKPPSERVIDTTIAEMKKRDRYTDPRIGFARDWSFKTGDEVMIDEVLAQKWEEAGQCVIISDGVKKAA